MIPEEPTFDIRVGASFSWDGSLCTVIEMAGNAVVVQDSNRRLRRLHYAELLRPPVEGGRARFPHDPDVGPVDPLALIWTQLSPAEREIVHQRAEHVREVLTGYKSGNDAYPRPGEPRPEYAPGSAKMDRYRAKATELGVSVRTISNWVARYVEAGELGLMDARRIKSGQGLGNLDPRWVDMARTVLAEQTQESRVPGKVLMTRVAARLEREYGPGVVRIPSESVRYRAFNDLDWGRNVLSGSTKSKRSNANKPQGTFGQLKPTRPGEYILMDTTPLDVFGFDPVTGHWVNSELTVAMDLYDRAIVGMRLTPTARAMDVAGVLLEAMRPFDLPETWGTAASWPYAGVPSTLIVREDRINVARFLRANLPETIVVDHGKIYLSEHVLSVCSRLGISVQPARVYMPTDKAAVERFFRTIKELLAQLPGYKGEDQSARGRNPEGDAVFTVSQLEEIIREWIATVYHVRPHSELADPRLPGMLMSPQQRYEQGIAIAGHLRLPQDRNIVLEMLPVVRRTIQRYGIENWTLRYKDTDGVLRKYRNQSQSLYNEGRSWPFFVNPDDVRYIYFRDPEDGTWHTLTWERLDEFHAPFGIDALEHAKKLAASDPEIPDTESALSALLARWGAGQDLTPHERRAAARQVAAHRHETESATMTSIRMTQELIARNRPTPVLPSAELAGPPVSFSEFLPPVGGDDDLDAELDATEFETGPDYYATALEDL